MDILVSLRCHSGLILVITMSRWVIMTNINLGGGRQRQYPLDRLIQGGSIPPRKIATRSTNIRHKERISHEYKLLIHDKTDICRGMPWGMHHPKRHQANLKHFPVAKQMIKLMTVG